MRRGEDKDGEKGYGIEPEEGGGGTKGKGGQHQKEEEKTKEKKEQREIETVIFIPYTPGGGLRKKLQEEDDLLTEMLGMKRVRFVEQGGICIAALL